MYLIDTMVVSEATKQRGAGSVLHWLAAQPARNQFISALSLGEVLYGVRRTPAGKRRNQLVAWVLNDLTPFFENRILPVDATVADVWANMRADSTRAVSFINGLIAATAIAHGLTLVTRNERDFTGLSVRVVNPRA